MFSGDLPRPPSSDRCLDAADVLERCIRLMIDGDGAASERNYFPVVTNLFIRNVMGLEIQHAGCRRLFTILGQNADSCKAVVQFLGLVSYYS